MQVSSSKAHATRRVHIPTQKNLETLHHEREKQLDERAAKYLITITERESYRNQPSRIKDLIESGAFSGVDNAVPIASPNSSHSPRRLSKSYLGAFATKLRLRLKPGKFSVKSGHETALEGAQGGADTAQVTDVQPLGTLDSIEKEFTTSSAVRVPLYQLFHLVIYHILPRRKAEFPINISQVPQYCTRRKFTLVDVTEPADGVYRLQNDLRRSFFREKNGPELLLLGIEIWEVYQYLMHLEEGGLHFMKDVLAALLNVAHFMYRFPREEDRASTLLTTIRHSVDFLVLARNKLADNDEVGFEQALNVLEREHLTESWRQVQGVISSVDADKVRDGERPYLNEPIDYALIKQTLRTNNIHVVEKSSHALFYRNKRMVGSGGFGYTHLVKVSEDNVVENGSSEHETEVVIKEFCMQPLASESPQLDTAILKRFYREARAWINAQSHPNILELFACWFIDGSYPILVSPLCNGGNLHNYVAKNPLSLAERLHLVLDVARGLEHLHTLTSPGPVIHGDLKSDNVLIHNRRALLCDFGLSAVVNDVKGLTTKHHGNDYFLAPEIFEARYEQRRIPLTSESDMHSFGCLTLETLTSKVPFYDLDLSMAKLHKIPLEDLEDIIPEAKQVGERYWMLVVGCWDEPSFRYTASEVVILPKRELYDLSLQHQHSSQQDAHM